MENFPEDAQIADQQVSSASCHWTPIDHAMMQRCLELARGAVFIALVGLGLLVVLGSRWVGVLSEWNACTTMLHGLAGMGWSLSVLQLVLVVHSGLEDAA